MPDEADLADQPHGQPVEKRARHVPYAQMDDEEKKKHAPDVDDHAAAGQVLSG